MEFIIFWILMGCIVKGTVAGWFKCDNENRDR